MTETPTGAKLKILCADRDRSLKVFDQKAAEVGAEIVCGCATTPEEIEPIVADADAVIVFRTYVSDRSIANMRQCKIILRQGIGYDLIDVPAATRAGIFVSNVPDYCIDEVASHSMTLMLAAVRNLLDYHRVMTTKGWGMFNVSRKIPSLDGLKLGIVGLGKIGRAVARMAKPFGFEISAYDPFVHQDVFDWMGARRILHLDELLSSCDVVTLHTPATAETVGMIGKRELELMKPGSFLVNTARGKIVDLAALNEALANGHLAAAGIDVFEEEPLDVDHPILKRDNLVATPHVAFYSEKSLREIVIKAIEEVARALRGERPQNLVNPEVFAHRD